MRIQILSIPLAVAFAATAWAQSSGDSDLVNSYPWRNSEESMIQSGKQDSYLIPTAPNMQRKNVFGKSKFTDTVIGPNQQAILSGPPSQYRWKSGKNRATSTSQQPALKANYRSTNSNVGRNLFDSYYQQQETEIAPGDYDMGVVPDAPVENDESADAVPPLSVVSNAQDSEPDYCDGCRIGRCRVGCPKKLIGRHRSGTDIGGWAQFGYTNRDTILFNDRKGSFNPQQLWLFFDKPATRHNGFGFRFDFAYGIDGQDLQAFGNGPVAGAPDGWDNDWDYGAGYGWAAPQAYAEFGNCCNTLKIGKFLTPFGFESVMSIKNFFYSHTYTRVLTEPFSGTGAIAEFDRGGGTEFILGATAGWDTGFDSVDNGFNVISGLRFDLNENVRISTTSSWGDTGYRGSGVLNSVIADVQLLPRINYVFQLDTLKLNLDHNDEFGVVNYLFYDISPCLAYGARLEWWKTDRLFPDTKSTWDLTLGANFMPNTNIVIRPELRMDWGAAALDPAQELWVSMW